MSNIIFPRTVYKVWNPTNPNEDEDVCVGSTRKKRPTCLT